MKSTHTSDESPKDDAYMGNPMLVKVINVFKNPSKLRRAPSLLLKVAMDLYHARKNYLQFLKSGKKAIHGDLPYDLDCVQRQFDDAGYKPVDYLVDLEAFNKYCMRHEEVYRDYKASYGDIFFEKALEHFVSLSFTSLLPTSKMIDIANAGSPFPKIVHNIYGCYVWSNDLTFPTGVHRNDWHTQIGGDACQLPVDENSFDLAVLHCALEMFEGDADMGLIREAERILKPGGTLVVTPLYMNETYHVSRDPKTCRNPLPKIDDGAELVYREHFYGVGFARFYNVAAFLKRLVDTTTKLDLTIYRVRNLSDIHAKCYMNWIAVFKKRGSQ
jgi:SAM-dependent methyltransferase